MNDSPLESNFVSTFSALRYVFPDGAPESTSIPTMAAGQKVLFTVAAGAVMGIAGALSVGYSKFTDADVRSRVGELASYCDFVGLRLDTGGALLALLIKADGLSDDALIGRSVRIRGDLEGFQKFALRVGFTKRGVIADTFFVFTNSENAFRFRRSIQPLCKHSQLVRKIYVLPWGIDVNAKSVWGYGGWPPTGYMAGLKLQDIEKNLFS